MQFEKPCSIFFAKVLRKVVWKSKSGQEKVILYFKVVVFSHNVTLDTQIAVLASLPKLFRQKSEMFSLKIWKAKKSVVLFSGKKLPQNVPMDTWNAFLTNQSKISSQKSDFFDESEKKTVSPQNVPLDTQIAVLASVPKLFRQTSEMFSLKSWKPKKVFFFSGKKLPKNVPLDTYIALLTSLPKKFRKNMEKFLQKKSDIGEKIFSPRKESSNFSSVEVKGSFDNPIENFLPKAG